MVAEAACAASEFKQCAAVRAVEVVEVKELYTQAEAV